MQQRVPIVHVILIQIKKAQSQTYDVIIT